MKKLTHRKFDRWIGAGDERQRRPGIPVSH